MAFNNLQHLEIIEKLENFMESIRPPENLRSKVDCSYKITDQSVILFTVRENLQKIGNKKELEVAKCTYVIKHGYWKVFWMRANEKWYPYDPRPKVSTLDKFLKLVKEDKYHCFWE